MAESLIKAARQLLLQGGMLLFVSTFSGIAAAENVRDPTRPPAALASWDAAPAAGPVLQSVLIAPGRRVAVINGQTVQVGDKVGDLRIIKIAETAVVLSNGKDLQTLKLFPGIEMRRTAGSANTRVVTRRP